jgi:hypothetical protein
VSLSQRELLAVAQGLEQRHGPFTTCSRCESPLCGTAERRLYTIAGGHALVVLCADCRTALPVDSRANSEFQQHLERNGLLHVPPQGHA